MDDLKDSKNGIFLYGPPGSGKSTVGRALAGALDLPFVDLDEEIVRSQGKAIVDIFASEGEARFRQLEREAIEQVLDGKAKVVALGGGALLRDAAREAAERGGTVLCLAAEESKLVSRLADESDDRPLLAGSPEERLRYLLKTRADHYASFPLRMDTTNGTPDELCQKAQVLLGRFRVKGMGQPYDLMVQRGSLDDLGPAMRLRGLTGPVVLVSDRNVAGYYQERVLSSLQAAGLEAAAYAFDPGEHSKTIHTVLDVWDAFLKNGIERGSTVVALGGGVVGDLTGFAASTYLRGVPWVNVPTSLLAMVDSSMGGKTGIDLPQAKNMVGAFYPPRLVLADPDVLATLPIRELRGGLAEVIKHGVIADPDLFELCSRGSEPVQANLEAVVRQAMAVKVNVIEVDPYEKGLRQALNLGHTIGHGVELASAFGLSHGEAVAIGMVAETRLAEQAGICEAGLASRIEQALVRAGLPVEIPQAIPRKAVIEAMLHDKKRSAGKVRFAVPVCIGNVLTGVTFENWQDALLEEKI